jgi:hypothetical protein
MSKNRVFKSNVYFLLDGVRRKYYHSTGNQILHPSPSIIETAQIQQQIPRKKSLNRLLTQVTYWNYEKSDHTIVYS